ncbi:MAG: hypothetical protein ABIP35_07015 [Ginsengibacter sp.]
MPLLIKTEDFKGEVLNEHNDEQGILNAVLEYCYQNPTKVNTLKYIDQYDDTTFNSLQVKDLILDIEFVKKQSQIMNKEKLEFLSLLINLCNETLKEPHQYLKFYGD